MRRLLLAVFFIPVFAGAQTQEYIPWCSMPWSVRETTNESTRWFEAGIEPDPQRGTYLYLTAGSFPHTSGIYGPVIELADPFVDPPGSRGTLHFHTYNHPNGRFAVNLTHPESALIVQSSGYTRAQYFPRYGMISFLEQDASCAGSLHFSGGVLMWENCVGKYTVLAE